MIKSVFATVLLASSMHVANALTLNVTWPEGIPETNSIICTENITSKDNAGHNMNSQTTHNFGPPLENALEYWGTVYLKNKTAREKPVPDGDLAHNFLEFQLAGSSNLCRINNIFKYKTVDVAVFLDGHCVITNVS